MPRRMIKNESNVAVTAIATPPEARAFTLTGQLIRGATRAIVQSEADRAVVLDTVRDNRETTR